MTMASRFEKLATILGLVFTSAVTVATSKASDSKSEAFPTTTFYAASNCQGAIPQEVIGVRLGQVVTPTGRTFQSYGLPAEFVTFGSADVTGRSGALERRCVYALYQPGVHLYTCYDNGVQACQVTFEVAPAGTARDTSTKPDSSSAPKDPSDPPQS